MSADYEFYETPQAFTRQLLRCPHLPFLTGRGLCAPDPHPAVMFEPCVGSGAIIHAAKDARPDLTWITNDLDGRWDADFALDAAQPEVWSLASGFPGVGWVITNPPFSQSLEILDHALRVAKRGVAMHLRASVHEVLKTGPRRHWMREHPPTGVIYLPRFAYQRSRTTGRWTTDTVGACWVTWVRGATGQFIDYADEQCLEELASETPRYRTRMDELMATRRAA